MSETQAALFDQPEYLDLKKASPTDEFAGALADAGRLMAYAASSGQLGEGAPACAHALIRDVVYAQNAERSGTLTPQIVIAFWMAYYFTQLKQRPLVATNDPHLAEILEPEHAHA